MFDPPEPFKVGMWYRVPNEPPFEVVAYDVDQEVIEIQYYDGAVGEYDFDTWTSLYIEPVAAPEDWSGAMDIDKADYGLDTEDVSHDLHQSPLNLIDHL